MNKLISIILLIALLTSPAAALAEFLPVNPGIPFNPVATATPAPVCSHSWTVVYRNEPSCDEYGDETLQCAKCGDWGDRSVEPLGHSWKWTTETEANCQRGGMELGECTRCGAMTERESPVGGHNYKWTVTKAASCQQSGSRRGKCRDCGKTTSETIKKADHSFGAWTITVPADENTAGERSRVCSVCAYTETEAYYPEGTLISGGENPPEIVTSLQQALTEAGYDCGIADGVFGKQTEDALKAYQTDTGREPDGIAWPSILIELGVIKSSLIEITDVAEPAAFEAPSASAKVITEGYRLATGKTVRWYFRDMEMRENECFLPGETYTVKILVNGAVEDASVLRATVNGREAGVSVLAGIITVSCDLVCPDADPGTRSNMINLPRLPLSMDIVSLDEPLQSKMADLSAQISGNAAQYFRIADGGVVWEYNTERIGGEFIDVAEKGGRFPNHAQRYRVEITVIPDEAFDPEKYFLECSINGTEAYINESKTVPGAYVVYKSFQYDVDKIEVSGLDKPFPGNKVDRTVNVRMHRTDSDSWYEYSHEIRNYMHAAYSEIHGTHLVSRLNEDTYRAGDQYTACIELSSMGYYFANGIEVSFEGAPVEFELNYDKVCFDVELSCEEQEIDQLWLTVSDPVEGSRPRRVDNSIQLSAQGRPLSVKADLEAIYWYDTDTGDQHAWHQDFTKAYHYKVIADLTPPEGFSFSQGISASVNGNPAEVRLIRGDWSSTEDKKFTGNAGTFVGGMMYTLALQLECGKANVFPDGMVMTSVNGDTAGPRPTSAGTKETLSFNFRCKPENIICVSNVNAGITVPVEGQSPDFSPVLSATDTQGNSVPVYFIEMSWTDVTDNRTLGENDVFIGGHSYKLYIRANFDPATELTLFDFTTSLNGALYASHSSAKLLGDKAVSLDYELTCEAAQSGSVIKNLYIDAVVPVAGATPDMNPALRAICEDSNAGVVSLSSVAWTDVTDVANLIPLTADSRFEAGHQYRVDVSTAAGEGMSFRGDAPAIFNGSYVGLKLENENTLGSAFNIFTVEAAAPETPETPGTTVEPEVPTDGSDASAGSEEDMKQPQEPTETPEPEVPGDGSDASAGSEEDMKQPQEPAETPEPEVPGDGSDASAGSEEDMKQPEKPESPVPMEPEPVVPEQPDPTKEPAVSVQPDPTKEPAVSVQPDPTKAPVVTEKPDDGNAEQPEDIQKEDNASASEGGGLSFRLTIPDTIVDETVTRSAYDNALDLYQAQLAGRTDDAASKLAKDWFEGCDNSIVYVPDMKDRGLYDAFEAMFAEEKPINEIKILYGPEGMQSEYELLALLHTEPSDKDYAICNMSDLSLPGIMDMYSVYLSSMALRSSGTAAEGDELLSIVVWNGDTLSDWRMLVARKV